MDVLGVDRFRKDSQTVTPDGHPVFRVIEGVHIQQVITHTDERGSLCEVFNPAWEFDSAPLVYMYQASILPGYVKGWTLHFQQSDRLFLSSGRLRLVLFDARKGSPTESVINHYEGGDLNRCLVNVPAGVYHAMQNIGTTEAIFCNLPTRAYRHDDPDKFRLPLNNDVIPYDFGDAKGW
ncbi:MAG: dTDP-4-dehydrorhamnose 3,5-epimerase [Candidatus Solibacter sp.]|nr:dTDP-4-dehydrorhamnose 3,5-epimerase [Candidatus Solibacter sp.]